MIAKNLERSCSDSPLSASPVAGAGRRFSEAPSAKVFLESYDPGMQTQGAEK
jgi:hypothetical protein